MGQTQYLSRSPLILLPTPETHTKIKTLMKY